MNKNIRIKNIGDVQSRLRLIKLDNQSTVKLSTLAPNESSAYLESVEDIKFSLFPLKKSEAVVEQPTEEVLTELIIAGKVTAAFVDAETFTITHAEDGKTTDLHAKFTSRISDNVLSTVVRKQHYLLRLGNDSDINLSNIRIYSTRFDAGTGDVVGSVNQLLPNANIYKTSTGDVVYPLVISELENQYYYDLVIDLDGDRSKYAPQYHRINVNVEVDQASESSIVTVRGLDAALIAELGSAITYKKEANSFSVVDTTTSIKNLISKDVNALFQYKLDSNIVLAQTFILQFEKELVDAASQVTMLMAGHEINKSELIANAKLVGEKYFYPITINNQAKTPTVVDVTLDYDGPDFNDYVKTNYRFKFNSNITTPPPIPLFALSAMRARIEIKDENTFYYEGYRFLQFKIPIASPSLVVIDVVASATNYVIKPLVVNNSVLPIADRAAAAAYAHFTENELYKDAAIGQERTYVYDQVGESVFQIKLPLGLTGTVYFGMTPINALSNLFTYDEEQMQIIGMEERIPSLGWNYWGGITLAKYKDTDTVKPYPGYFMFNELVVPGTAIAIGDLSADNTWKIWFTRPDIKLTEINPIEPPRNANNKPLSMLITRVGFNVYNPNGSVKTSIDFYDDWDYSLYGGMYAVYRTKDNKLIFIRYRTVNDIVVEVASEHVLVNDLAAHGYTPDTPIRVTYASESAPSNARVNLTRPYEITYEELTTFDPELTFTTVASVDVIDIYGSNYVVT